MFATLIERDAVRLDERCGIGQGRVARHHLVLHVERLERRAYAWIEQVRVHGQSSVLVPPEPVLTLSPGPATETWVPTQKTAAVASSSSPASNT